VLSFDGKGIPMRREGCTGWWTSSTSGVKGSCDECRSDYLVAFSCSRRVFCPSCTATRGAIFGALLREEILAEVGHPQWVFTIPKSLRPFFLHHRELLGRLSQAAGRRSMS
jgi:hypothetical protein